MARFGRRLFQFGLLVILGVAGLVTMRSCDYGPQVRSGRTSISQDLNAPVMGTKQDSTVATLPRPTPNAD